jgi:protein-tyrosine phosphatase
MKVLMVCLGNICRSPLAEGVLKHKASAAGLNWTVESAGTGNWHIGEAPHRLSQKVAKLNGVDISQQQGRQFVKEDMQRYDLILAMDNQNLKDIRRMSGSLWNPAKVNLLLNYSYPAENRDVPDPWYGGEPDFHDVYKMIDTACDRIIEKHRSEQ